MEFSKAELDLLRAAVDSMVDSLPTRAEVSEADAPHADRDREAYLRLQARFASLENEIRE